MKKQPYHQPILTRHLPQRALAAKTAGECALLLVMTPPTEASPPELTLTQVGGNVVLSWAASGSNCVLESSTAIAVGWKPVAAARAVSGSTIRVTLPIEAQQFFRLKDAGGDKDAGEKTSIEKTGDKTATEKTGDKTAGEKTGDKTTDKDPNSDKDPTEKEKEMEVTPSVSFDFSPQAAVPNA